MAVLAALVVAAVFVAAFGLASALLLAGHARAENWPAPAARTALVPFAASPFPYAGDIPEQNKPFLDVNGRSGRGHTSPRGGVYYEEPTYADRRSLLFMPKGFDPRRPFAVVLYLHGNLATLEGEVIRRQRVTRQLAQSGINAVLLVPQFAVNALDSSAGHFWEKGHLSRYLAEAADKLAAFAGDQSLKAAFAAAPVILVAYSGGYLPAAFSLERGGADARLYGVILLDALYAEEARFAAFFASHPETFLFSAFSASTRAENGDLQHLLKEKGVRVSSGLPEDLKPGVVTFLATPGHIEHKDFVTRAWTSDPLAAALGRVRAFARGTDRGR